MDRFILFFLFFFLLPEICSTEPISLKIIEKEIQVLGKQAKVYAIVQPDGQPGLIANKGELFEVNLQNALRVPTSIHWHGVLLPNNQDGVAFITQFPIYPGNGYRYQYPILQSGTFFMHSHFPLQEQQLLSAPLIFREEGDALIAEREIIMLLTDFSFTSPFDLFLRLRCPKGMKKKDNKADIIDVEYDAFLANYKTLEDPEIYDVKPEERIRLRIINASSATNFFIQTDLKGIAIAVDGNRIEPFAGTSFELGIAQRIDIVVTIPKEGGIFPILAKGEATFLQAGIILNAGQDKGKIDPLPLRTKKDAGVFTNKQEENLRALYPLRERPIDRKVNLELGGDMARYVWTINGQAWPEITPVEVREGERVEITFTNKTMMTHPMHLHGHVFQVTEIDGKIFKGAVRDTVLVGPRSTLKIQFDANNPGVWPLHCHLLYHLEAGMLTVVRYKDYVQPL